MRDARKSNSWREKKRQQKRRLIQTEFVHAVTQALKPGGMAGLQIITIQDRMFDTIFCWISFVDAFTIK